MSNKISFLSRITILISLCALSTFAQDIESPVAVKLSLANDKAVYRSGEAIGLVLSFSTDRNLQESVSLVTKRSAILHD